MTSSFSQTPGLRLHRDRRDTGGWCGRLTSCGEGPARNAESMRLISASVRGQDHGVLLVVMVDRVGVSVTSMVLE